MGREVRGFSAFLRLFSVLALAAVCIGALCCCDSQDVESLFQPSDFTVTFVLNNGEENVVWHKGDDVPTPQKKDFEFLYWCSDADLTSKANLDFEKLNLVNSITVYAKWKELDEITGVVFKDFSCVYDTNHHSVIVENLPDGATVAYDKQNVQVNAGVYPIVATIKKEGCKDLVLSATLTIGKAKVENIQFPSVIVNWDGQAYGAFVTSPLPDEVKVSYTSNGQSEVGEYVVTAKFEVSENYEPIADMTTKLVINETYFNVIFDDGICAPIVKKVAHGETLEDIPVPTPKRGYMAQWQEESVVDVFEDITVHALYIPIDYTVSFVSDNEVISSESYNIESELTFEDASKPYYIFGGWFEDENCFGGRVSGLDTGNVGDRTFYAKWTCEDYYVCYHLNGGQNSELNTNVEDKYKYTVESDEFEFQAPSKKNYVFDGWYASPDFEGERISALKKGAHGNINLYAKWTAEKFDIIYDLKGGVNDANNPAFTSVESGEIVLLPATRDCYDFVCWKDKSNRVVEKIAASTACEVYLVAVWKAKEYTVEYELGGGIDAENKTSYTVEDGSFALNAPSRKGYKFDGWYSSEDFSGEKTESVNCSLAINLKFYAKWSIETYIIEYDLSGGDAVRNQTEYTVESEDISLHAPKREGYEFDGWFDKANNLVERIKKGSVGDIKLKAKWSALTYTVTFVSDCTISVAPIEYTIESDTIVIEYPKRNNYIFEGWFDAKGNKVDRIAGGTVGNVTLYAKWRAVEYTVTFESNGGDAVNSIIYTVETESFDLPVCNKSDYEFEGWFSGETKIERIEKGSCGNIALVAKWRAIGFKVSFETNGGSKVADKTYNVEMTEFELPVPTREYYAFCGWFENSDLSGEPIENFATNKDVTLYAKWRAIEYTVRFESNGGESVKPCIYTVESQGCVLAATEKKHYDFEGWVDKNGNKYTVITNENPSSFTLYAVWTPTKYTVTFDSNGGNEIMPYVYTVESEGYALAQAEKEYYDFEGWYDGDKKVEFISADNPSDFTLTAKWVAHKYVVVLKDGASVSKLPYTVESQDFALQIPQKDFYLFEGWMDDAGNKVEKIDCSNPKDVRLTAQWSAIEYTITYVLNGGTNGENPTVYTVESEDIVLVAPTKDGFVFDGWFLNDDKTERIAKGSHGNLTLVARWTEEVIVIPSDFIVENGIVTAYNGSATSITLHATESGEIVKSIANRAFDSVRTTVKEILIEEGIQSVEQGVFEGMSALQTLILPSTISVMHKSMLQDCASLVNLTVPFASFWIDGTQDDNGEFYDASATIFDSSNELGVSYGLTYLFGENAVSNASPVQEYSIHLGNRKAGRTVYIPDGLKNITVLGGDITQRAFSGCSNLENVRFEHKVKKIDNLAFYNCSALKRIEFADASVNFGISVLNGSDGATIYVASEEQKELFVKNNPDYADRVQIK